MEVMRYLFPSLALMWYLWFVRFFARFEAKKDANDIEQGNPIHHAEVWCVRAIIVILFAMATMVFQPDWVTAALPLLAVGAFGFSTVFRWRLNKLRKLDWRYVAPWSNVYDRTWFAIVEREWDGSEWMQIRKDIYFATPEGRTARNVHRAGMIAYLAESLINLSALAWLVWSIINQP